jgi:hypothetical protein
MRIRAPSAGAVGVERRIILFQTDSERRLSEDRFGRSPTEFLGGRVPNPIEVFTLFGQIRSRPPSQPTRNLGFVAGTGARVLRPGRAAGVGVLGSRARARNKPTPHPPVGSGCRKGRADRRARSHSPHRRSITSSAAAKQGDFRRCYKNSFFVAFKASLFLSRYHLF